MSKHTSWKHCPAFENNAPSYYAIIENRPLNEIWGKPPIAAVYEKRYADLIAAAPEMLEALEQAREAVEGYARERWSNPEGWTEYRAIVNAINKAKGID